MGYPHDYGNPHFGNEHPFTIIHHHSPGYLGYRGVDTDQLSFPKRRQVVAQLSITRQGSNQYSSWRNSLNYHPEVDRIWDVRMFSAPIIFYRMKKIQCPYSIYSKTAKNVGPLDHMIYLHKMTCADLWKNKGHNEGARPEPRTAISRFSGSFRMEEFSP